MTSSSRIYYDADKRAYPASQYCEHCDGEHSSRVRLDYLRGRVCPECDEALDAMLNEKAPAR